MEALGIDIRLIIAQLINFLLFFYLFKKIFAKPFLKFITEQKNIQKEKERILKELQEKEANINLKEKEILSAASTQALNIINEAKKNANTIKEESISKTLTETQDIKEKAKKQIEEDRKKMEKEIYDQILKTSEAITKKVISEFVTDNKQEQIIDNLFEKISKNQ